MNLNMPYRELTVKENIMLIMPSLSSPCLPDRLYQSSTASPFRAACGIAICDQAILSSPWNVFYKQQHEVQALAGAEISILIV